uniref:Glycoside hydrolase family 42 N-terminal domain-containing protein n=1 Tax=candidate division WWE3 bacterium TaxID=2053526 RepID=A0A831YSH0_UNCKA
MNAKRFYLKLILRIFLGLLGVLAVLVLAAYLLFGRGGEASQIIWGASFDAVYAESLGLDWKETYLSLLDEVGVDHLRLVAFWDVIEPQGGRFDFSALDFQMAEAQKRGIPVILAVGRRLPRWPECHEPAWVQNQSSNIKNQKLLDYIREVVTRYKDSPVLEFWQVENEPFVGFFGECPKPDRSLLKLEIDQVAYLDPSHPILLTDSGEISTWFPISGLGENLGISMYRVIYDGNYTKLYIRYWPFFPQWYYRVKANFYKRIGRLKTVFVSEMQAEPWGKKPLTQMSLEEQYISLSPEKLRANIAFARSAGFDRIYLWGAEWWFYAREKLGVPDFVEIVKKLWRPQSPIVLD